MCVLKATLDVINGVGGRLKLPSALHHDHAYDSIHFVTRIFMAALIATYTTIIPIVMN